MTQERDAYGRFVGGGSRQGRPVETGRELNVLLKRATTHAVRLAIILAYQAISIGTPVDLGTARSRWIVSVGRPILEVPELGGLNDEEVKTLAARTYAKNQRRAKAISDTYILDLGSAFIANATPWIVFLNEGSSSQAPAKFVEAALETAVRTAEATAA